MIPEDIISVRCSTTHTRRYAYKTVEHISMWFYKCTHKKRKEAKKNWKKKTAFIKMITVSCRLTLKLPLRNAHIILYYCQHAHMDVPSQNFLSVSHHQHDIVNTIYLYIYIYVYDSDEVSSANGFKCLFAFQSFSLSA